MATYLKTNIKKRQLIVFVLICLAIFIAASYGASADDVNKPGLSTYLLAPFKYLLGGLFTVISWLITVAAMILAWVLNPEHVSGDKGLYNLKAIVGGWKIIRDFLNLAFIFVLIFSAFSTIFQYQKYHLSKVIWTLVLMALLVNFSYPITRFLIDVSNVALYFFLESFFGGDIYNVSKNGQGIYGQFLGASAFQNVMMPASYWKYDISAMISMIIFSFLMLFTLLTISILMLVRMFAFAILIIVSPLAFVAQMMPGHRSFADEWWKKLINFAILGPGLLFVLFVATHIMKEIPQENMIEIGVSNSTAVSASWLATIAYMMLPIAILWLGMLEVIKFAAAGGNMAMDVMRGKFAKKGLSKASKALGISGGLKKGWEQSRKTGRFAGRQIPFLKSGVKRREETFAGAFTEGRRGAQASKEAYKIAERKEGAAHYKYFSDDTRNEMLEDKSFSIAERGKVAQSLIETNDVRADNLGKLLGVANATGDPGFSRDVFKEFLESIQRTVKSPQDVTKALKAINEHNFIDNKTPAEKKENQLKLVRKMDADVMKSASRGDFNDILDLSKGILDDKARGTLEGNLVENNRFDILLDYKMKEAAGGEVKFSQKTDVEKEAIVKSKEIQDFIKNKLRTSKNASSQKKAWDEIKDDTSLIGKAMKEFVKEVKTMEDKANEAGGIKANKSVWTQVYKDLNYDIKEKMFNENLAPGQK